MSCKPLSQSCQTLHTFYSPSKKKLAAVVALTTLVAGVVLIGIGAYYLKGSGAIASVSAGGLSLLGFGASSLYFIILSCKKTTKPATHKVKGTQAKAAKNAPEQKEPTEADGSTTQIGQAKVAKNALKQKKAKNTENQDGHAKVAKKASEQKEPTKADSSKTQDEAEVAQKATKQKKTKNTDSSKVKENQTKSDKSKSPIEVSSAQEVTEPEVTAAGIYVNLIQAKLEERKNQPPLGWNLGKFVELDFKKLRGEFCQTDLGKSLVNDLKDKAFIDEVGKFEEQALDRLVATDIIRAYKKLDYNIEEQKRFNSQCYRIQVEVPYPSPSKEKINVLIEILGDLSGAKSITLDYLALERIRQEFRNRFPDENLTFMSFLQYMHHALNNLHQEKKIKSFEFIFGSSAIIIQNS